MSAWPEVTFLGFSNVGTELLPRRAWRAAAHAAARRADPHPANVAVPVEMLEIVEWKRSEKHGRSPFGFGRGAALHTVS